MTIEWRRSRMLRAVKRKNNRIAITIRERKVYRTKRTMCLLVIGRRELDEPCLTQVLCSRRLSSREVRFIIGPIWCPLSLSLGLLTYSYSFLVVVAVVVFVVVVDNGVWVGTAVWIPIRNRSVGSSFSRPASFYRNDDAQQWAEHHVSTGRVVKPWLPVV